ncbi:hypothetical protein CHARACLAT_026629, partial [Characodon lateralis]|nr:hypothetical protein [Characodon lateralis]
MLQDSRKMVPPEHQNTVSSSGENNTEDTSQSPEGSTPRAPSPNKEAKIYCIECPRCSRDIVSITESGQDKFNIKISLQPGNEKVCSEKNRDEV